MNNSNKEQEGHLVNSICNMLQALWLDQLYIQMHGQKKRDLCEYKITPAWQCKTITCITIDLDANKFGKLLSFLVYYANSY